MTEEERPAHLEIIDKRKAERAAERAAVEEIRHKETITPADFGRLFNEEARAIESILDTVESAFDFALMICERTAKTGKMDKEDAGEITFLVERGKGFRARIMQHCLNITQALKKMDAPAKGKPRAKK